MGYNKLMTFRVDMFLTLTQLDELDPGNVPSNTACPTNTNYPCKAGARQGEQGQQACYADDEECTTDSDGNLMCFCQAGTCLAGSGSTAACSRQSAEISGAQTAGYQFMVAVAATVISVLVSSAVRCL